MFMYLFICMYLCVFFVLLQIREGLERIIWMIRFRLPVTSECSDGQTARITSNLQPTSSMAVSRVPSPPPQEVNTPVAENWCYTQVMLLESRKRKEIEMWKKFPSYSLCNSIEVGLFAIWTICCSRFNYLAMHMNVLYSIV